MSKVVDTRIRVEQSELKTEYFPEYCIETRTWYGRTKREWCGDLSLFCPDPAFRIAYLTVSLCPSLYGRQFTRQWAESIINVAAELRSIQGKERLHKETRKTSYI